MMDRLFGPHRSVQRQLCIVLAVVLFVLGLGVAVTRDLLLGMLFSLAGVVAGAVMARTVESHTARVASAENLGRLSDADPEVIQGMVTRARGETSGPLGKVTDQTRREELREAVKQTTGEFEIGRSGERDGSH